MNNSSFNKAMLALEKRNVWLINMTKLRVMFPQESDATLRSSIRRLIKAGNIIQIAQGLYARPTALARPRDALGSLINHLRPDGVTYLSLESRLSELGVISQVPTVATFMTTGRSGRFETGLGAIEFVHTSQPAHALMDHLVFNEDFGYYQGSASLAYRDLRRVRRNLDLVDLGELQEIIAEQEHLSRISHTSPTSGFGL